MKNLKKFNEEVDERDDVDAVARIIAEFYAQYEDSYINANTHGVIEILIKRLQRKGILPQGDLMSQIDTLSDGEYDIENDD